MRDHAEVIGTGTVDEPAAIEAMRLLEIDDAGLDSTDRKLLAAIIQKFASGPVGVAALAAVLSEEIETIEDVYEPYLLRLGLPRSDAAGPDRDRGGAQPPRRPRLRDPAAAPRRAGHRAAVGGAGLEQRGLVTAVATRRDAAHRSRSSPRHRPTAGRARGSAG